MATASALEVELTPLDVLTELCCIASGCGLLGTDRSSELSSLSAAERGEKEESRFLKNSCKNVSVGCQHTRVKSQGLTKAVI